MTLLMLAVVLGIAAKNPYKKYTQDLPFAMAEVKAPTIPDRRVVLDNGGDHRERLCTETLQTAIDQLARQGGGHVVLRRGVWLTGPIVLRSNIDLHLEQGAVLQFAADESLYPLVKTSFEGLDTRAVPGCLVRNHGPFAWGSDPADAVYHAVVLEEVAKMATLTELVSHDPQASLAPQYLQDKHYLRKHGPNAYYGQV